MPAAACQYQPACPGCPLFGEPGVGPTAHARLHSLAERLGAPPPKFEAAAGERSRARCRLSVRGTKKEPRIGIFEAGSHRLVHIPLCPLHHIAIEEVVALLLRRIVEAGIPPYREDEHRGLLRTVQLAVERKSGTVQVVLVVNVDLERRPAPDFLLDFAQTLAREPSVHSVFLNAQPRRTNTLLGPTYERIVGPPALEDRSGSATAFYPPAAFGQANPGLHERAVARIHQLAEGRGPLVEFYAGVGSIGLGLAARGQEIVFNEVGEGSLEGLRLGLEALHLDPEPRIFAGRAGAHAALVEGADVVLVDPPRKGLDPELLDALVKAPPARLVYLSCGLDALERESEVLAAAGLEVTELTGFNYFPFTDHVETLAVFERPG